MSVFLTKKAEFQSNFSHFFSFLHIKMHVTVRFEAELTHPLLSKAQFDLPGNIRFSEDFYAFLRETFRIKVNFDLFFEGFFLPPKQNLREILAEKSEIFAYRRSNISPKRVKTQSVCQFYLAVKKAPYGVVLVPTTTVCSAPVQGKDR